MHPPLTIKALKRSVYTFTRENSRKDIHELYGVTDGKAVGTYVEVLFNSYLKDRFSYAQGSAATGIDFPSLGIDLKVTSIRQPQSSSPFKSAEQKVYGLGHDLLILVYEKRDNQEQRTAQLDIQHAVFVNKEQTADHQTTRGILDILVRDGNKDDLIAFFDERSLPLDDIGKETLAEKVLGNPPKQGYLTISNALQWRLQYRRVIDLAAAGTVDGVENVFQDLGQDIED
jgi:hypothetical protein